MFERNQRITLAKSDLTSDRTFDNTISLIAPILGPCYGVLGKLVSAGVKTGIYAVFFPIGIAKVIQMVRAPSAEQRSAEERNAAIQYVVQHHAGRFKSGEQLFDLAQQRLDHLDATQHDHRHTH